MDFSIRQDVIAAFSAKVRNTSSSSNMDHSIPRKRSFQLSVQTKQVLRIRIRMGSIFRGLLDLNPYSKYGSGSRRLKRDRDSNKKFTKRTELKYPFSVSLAVLLAMFKLESRIKEYTYFKLLTSTTKKIDKYRYRYYLLLI